VTPTSGLGNDRHDYGNGFYLTDDIELAKEWAVCKPNEKNGWVHTYTLHINNLNIFFQKVDILILMKHRNASDSKRYKMLATKFISKYDVDISHYDVIRGWRANALYFYIAKEFVRDNVDIAILEELLSLGGLGMQYCIKSKLSYDNLFEVKEELHSIEYYKFNNKYNRRDIKARKIMK